MLAEPVFVQYALVASDIGVVATANDLTIALVNICIALNTLVTDARIIEARITVDRCCLALGGTSVAPVAGAHLCEIRPRG